MVITKCYSRRHGFLRLDLLHENLAHLHAAHLGASLGHDIARAVPLVQRVVHSLFNLLHRGYTGVYASGDGDKGVAKCPFSFYDTWVNNPELAQAQVEKITRGHIGVNCCPVAGVPTPSQEQVMMETENLT